jgi:hypothetical protein
MIGKAFLGSLALLAAAAASQASVTIESTSIDTPGLPGFKTWTLTALSTDPITAIDFVGDGRNDASTGKGFFGRMNQVGLPAGLHTIFEDGNVLIPIVGNPAGSLVAHDSQFKVSTGAVVVPPGLAEESPNLLQAAWAWSAPQGNSVPFAQIVIPTGGGNVGFRGTVTALVNGVQTDFEVSTLCCFPTPVVVVDVDLGAKRAGLSISHTFSTSPPVAPIWGDLVVTTPGGSPPINAPTLTTSGQFTWQSDLSDTLGAYTFEVKASNLSGSDVGRLTVILVPESSACLLFTIGGLVTWVQTRYR